MIGGYRESQLIFSIFFLIFFYYILVLLKLQTKEKQTKNNKDIKTKGALNKQILLQNKIFKVINKNFFKNYKRKKKKEESKKEFSKSYKKEIHYKNVLCCYLIFAKIK